MSTIGDRIRAVRKQQQLTIVKFGDHIGISNSAVSMMETGKTNPSNQTIVAICREFGVNEIWLRTGEGDMFRPMSRREELADFAGDVLAGNVSHSVEALVLLVKRLPESVIDLAMDELRRILAEQDTEDSRTPVSNLDTGEEKAAEK